MRSYAVWGGRRSVLLVLSGSVVVRLLGVSTFFFGSKARILQAGVGGTMYTLIRYMDGAHSTPSISRSFG